MSSAWAWATRAVNTRSHVSSTAHIRNRLQTLRRLPYLSGTGVAVRAGPAYTKWTTMRPSLAESTS